MDPYQQLRPFLFGGLLGAVSIGLLTFIGFAGADFGPAPDVRIDPPVASRGL